MAFSGLYQAKVNPSYDVVSYEALIRPVCNISTATYIKSIQDKDSFDISVVDFFIDNLANSSISLPISINIFSNSFYTDNFINMCEKNIGRLDFILEVTEHEPIVDLDRAREAMVYLNLLGIEFSLDDYGRGYSSYELMNALPFTEVKIDKSLVHTTTKSFGAFRALKENVERIKDKGISRIVYEGIEDSHMEALVLECDPQPILQGYHYSKLRSISDFMNKPYKSQTNSLLKL